MFSFLSSYHDCLIRSYCSNHIESHYISHQVNGWGGPGNLGRAAYLIVGENIYEKVFTAIN
jgi:hypothetical protein